MLSVGYVARHGLRLFLGLVKLGKLDELEGGNNKNFMEKPGGRVVL